AAKRDIWPDRGIARPDCRRRGGQARDPASLAGWGRWTRPRPAGWGRGRAAPRPSRPVPASRMPVRRAGSPVDTVDGTTLSGTAGRAATMQRSPIRWTSSPGTGFAVAVFPPHAGAGPRVDVDDDRLHVGLSEWCTGPVQHLTRTARPRNEAGRPHVRAGPGSPVSGPRVRTPRPRR